MASQHLGTSPGAANPEPSHEYGTGLEVLHASPPQAGQGGFQKEPGLNSGLEGPGGGVWGMRKKTFMIVLGICILIVAVAAGVGCGVGVAVARSKNSNNGRSESARQNSSYVA